MDLLSPGLRKLLFLSAVISVSIPIAAATKHVDVGNIFFTDVASNTSNPAITVINVGDTVEWDWVTDGGTHTTTSGSCQGGGCAPDGLWDHLITFENTLFSRTFNTPGTFTYYCIPHGPLMQGIVIVVQPGDFTVSVFDSTGGTVGGPIFPGQQMVFDGAVAASNEFKNAVSLSCQPGATGLPSTCTPSPANETPTFNFTITAGANIPGHYSFNAQGTDGTLTRFFPDLNFDVVDFGIAAPVPSSITAFSKPASTSTSSSTTVTLSAAGSLPDSVILACENNTLPMGWTCNFPPPGFYNPTASVPADVGVSVTVPAATPSQDYSLLLDATSDTNAGSATKTQPLTLHVVQFNASAFSPGSVTIGAGNVSNAATTQLTASPNFSGTVTMACTAGLPAGGVCSFSPDNGMVASFPAPPQLMTVYVPFNTAANSPTLTVTATGNSGGVSAMQNQPLTLNIPSPALSEGTPSPATVTMVNNSFSLPVTVLITPTNLAGMVTLSCGNLPPGVTCNFLPSATVNVNGKPVSVAVIFEANGATAPSVATNITINADATINDTPVSNNVKLTQLNINAPDATTDVTLNVAAVNSVTSSTLINIGDPNLKITASVNNGGSTYSAAVWEIGFSNPVILVSASATNATCTQLLPTAISCDVGDVPNGSSTYSFRVAPLFGRSLVINNLLTSASIGDSNLTDNVPTPLTVPIRPRPLARKGLVPKTP